MHEKKFWEPNYWGKGAKIGPKTSFFYHFLRVGLVIFQKIAYNNCLQQCITHWRGKTQKSFWNQI